jgi:hypothetical protein
MQEDSEGTIRVPCELDTSAKRALNIMNEKKEGYRGDFSMFQLKRY